MKTKYILTAAVTFGITTSGTLISQKYSNPSADKMEKYFHKAAASHGFNSPIEHIADCLKTLKIHKARDFDSFDDLLFTAITESEKSNKKTQGCMRTYDILL